MLLTPKVSWVLGTNLVKSAWEGKSTVGWCPWWASGESFVKLLANIFAHTVFARAIHDPFGRRHEDPFYTVSRSTPTVQCRSPKHIVVRLLPLDESKGREWSVSIYEDVLMCQRCLEKSMQLRARFSLGVWDIASGPTEGNTLNKCVEPIVILDGHFSCPIIQIYIIYLVVDLVWSAKQGVELTFWDAIMLHNSRICPSAPANLTLIWRNTINAKRQTEHDSIATSAEPHKLVIIKLSIYLSWCNDSLVRDRRGIVIRCHQSNMGHGAQAMSGHLLQQAAMATEPLSKSPWFPRLVGSFLLAHSTIARPKAPPKPSRSREKIHIGSVGMMSS